MRRNGGAYERRAQRARLENLDTTPQEHVPMGEEASVEASPHVVAPAALAPRISHRRRRCRR